MVLHEYKTEVYLDLIFIIIGSFLKIIIIDRLPNINNYYFQISIVQISYKPITMDLLFLEQKVESF